MHRHLKPILPAPTPTQRPPSPVPVPKQRPLRSCTRCRLHKTKCDAILKKPLPCTHCSRKGLVCELDLAIPPQRSNILKKLSTQITELSKDLNALMDKDTNVRIYLEKLGISLPPMSPPRDLDSELSEEEEEESDYDDYIQYKSYINNRSPTPLPINIPPLLGKEEKEQAIVHPSENIEYAEQDVFQLSNFTLSKSQVNTYFDTYIQVYLPYLPIPILYPPQQLYHKSQLLFWCIILTSSLSNEDSSIYNTLTPLVKELIIETCWYNTPRSAHILHALLIVTTWPLPSLKYMDDLSYRLLGLCKNISLQVGLHRGKFINEFSSGVIGKNLEYRNLLWGFNFINNGFWCDYFGIPELFDNDYIIYLLSKKNENEQDLYISTGIRLIIIHNKIINQMGNSITNTGLINFNERFLNLSIWEAILNDFDSSSISNSSYSHIMKIMVIFIKLKLFTFAFFPNTPINDLAVYIKRTVSSIYEITELFCTYMQNKSILTIPVHLRFPLEFVCFLTMRLVNYPMCPVEEYVGLKNCLSQLIGILQKREAEKWNISNDISRTTRILKNFEISVMIKPNLIISQKFMINNIMTHLNSSIIFEVIYLSHHFEKFIENNADDEDNEEDALPIEAEPDWDFFGIDLSNKTHIEFVQKLYKPESIFMKNLIGLSDSVGRSIKDTEKMNEKFNINGLNDSIDFLIGNMDNFEKLVQD